MTSPVSKVVQTPARRAPAPGALATLTYRLPHRWSVWHGLLLALLLAVPAAALAISRGFDGLYGQDAYAYFDYATASVRQSIQHFTRLEAFFWPPGYPLLVALTSLVVGPSALAGQGGLPFAAYALWTTPPRALMRTMVHALTALAVAAAILVPVVGPPLLGLVSHPTAPASFAGNFQVYSWSPLNAFARDFFTADGHLSYAQPNGVYYAIAPANLAFFGPLLAPWIVVGLWAAFREWRRPTLVLIVGWAAMVYAFHAGAPWQNFRFSLAYLPPLAILVSAGLHWTWVHV